MDGKIIKNDGQCGLGGCPDDPTSAVADSSTASSHVLTNTPVMIDEEKFDATSFGFDPNRPAGVPTLKKGLERYYKYIPLAAFLLVIYLTKHLK